MNETMSQSALETRLHALEFLQAPDWDALTKLLERQDHVEEGELVLLENQETNSIRVIKEGWAYRYKSFSDGRRQILNLILPGDVIGFYAIMRNRSDYGVEALTSLTMFTFPAASLIEFIPQSPRLVLGLSWIAGQSELLLDEQITRIGRRNAVERMAHLFVELFVRLRSAGFKENQSCTFPLTQTILADTLGMSHVHANRSFKTLVRQGAVRLEGGNIEILDIGKLARRAKFDSNYLQQAGVPDQTESAMPDTPQNG